MKTGYAKSLRATGQALEDLPLRSFDLEPENGDYLVRGELEGKPPKKAQLKDEHGRAIRTTWPRFLGRYPTVFQVRYTSVDIDRLHQEGQTKRRDPHGMPDPFSLAQVMRGVGTYVDSKGARLLKISSRQQNTVTVVYETHLGKKEEELGVPTLYSIWQQTYLRRTSRKRQLLRVLCALLFLLRI